VRVEVGPRDVAEGTCVAARRDRPGREGKTFGVPLEPEAFVAHLRGLLDDVQARQPPMPPVLGLSDGQGCLIIARRHSISCGMRELELRGETSLFPGACKCMDQACVCTAARRKP